MQSYKIFFCEQQILIKGYNLNSSECLIKTIANNQIIRPNLNLGLSTTLWLYEQAWTTRCDMIPGYRPSHRYAPQSSPSAPAQG